MIESKNNRSWKECQVINDIIFHNAFICSNGDEHPGICLKIWHSQIASLILERNCTNIFGTFIFFCLENSGWTHGYFLLSRWYLPVHRSYSQCKVHEFCSKLIQRKILRGVVPDVVQSVLGTYKSTFLPYCFMMSLH